MAHFAKLDSSNIVTQVTVVGNKDTSDVNGIEKEYIGQAFLENLLGGNWVQTSYNNNFRIRYAGIGYTYRKDLNTSNTISGAFVPPKPHNSWTLNTEYTFNWESPIEEPTPPEGHMYVWVEDTYVSNSNGWHLVSIS